MSVEIRRGRTELHDAAAQFIQSAESFGCEALTREEEAKYFSQIERGRAGYLLLKLFAPNDPWGEKEFKAYLSDESAQEFLSTTGFKPYVNSQENSIETKKKGSKPKEKNIEGELVLEGDILFVLIDTGCSFTDYDRGMLRRYIDEGKRAKEHIISHNLKWVINRVYKLDGKGVDTEDLIQEGSMGMLRAVEKFDRRRGFRFTTYATKWIEQSVQRGIADMSRTIRFPVHAHELVEKFFKIRFELADRLGREPEDSEIAEEWGVTVKSVIKVREALRIVDNMHSLDSPIGEDQDATVEDIVPDLSIPDFGDIAAQNEIGRRVREILETHPNGLSPNGLSPQEAQAVWCFFGFDREDGIKRTLKEAGNEIGRTSERVRQLVKLALGKMKEWEEIRELVHE